MTDSDSDPDLLQDPLLRAAPTLEGFKVLDPAVLYAKVGQGGMGAVYRGRHCKLDLDVAVKCLKPSLAAESPDFVARFEREARLAASLAHQNIVRVMDVQQRDGLHYLVMEFVRGESVRERVQRKGPLPEAEALAILHGAAAGLAEAHARGIVHRDIKPDNLLVSLEGRVKVADLGLAKAPPGAGQSLAAASAVMGTPQYMAPEQWDSPDVTPAADVWALGVTLQFVLTGEHAIAGGSFAQMARAVQEHDLPPLPARLPAVSPAVAALFARCVARRPQDRFATAKELLAALQPLLTVGEDALADAGAGSNRARLATVTPPPRQTLVRIRAALETATRAGAGFSAGEAPTMPSPGQTMPMPPPRAARPRARRWGGLGLAAALLVAVGLWFGSLAGWFDDPAEWERTQRLVEARAAYAEAQQRLPEAAGLDVAIERLERVLELQPGFAPAQALLALALDKRAERLAATDLDLAWTTCERALSFDPQLATAVQRRDELGDRLRARILFGLELDEPADDAVLDEAPLRLRGRVAAPGVAKVQVWLTFGAGDTAVEQWVDATVVAGEFTASVHGFPPGLLRASVHATDRHGITAHTLPTICTVAGVEGGRRLEPLPEPLPRLWTSCGIAMVPVPAGAFPMGSLELELGRGAGERRCLVQLSAPYWLATTEVTQREWFTVMETRPWLPAEATDDAPPGSLPATGVSFVDAVRFCARLTEREAAAGRLPAGYRYDLPSEAQWERAARGGDLRVFPHGDDVDRLAAHARHASDGPAVVAASAPTGYGLYDVAGNVDEWCADAIDALPEEPLAGAAAEGVPYAMDLLRQGGSQRSYRGGNFRSPPEACRCAARALAPPATARDDLGFRPALVKR